MVDEHELAGVIDPVRRHAGKREHLRNGVPSARRATHHRAAARGTDRPPAIRHMAALRAAVPILMTSRFDSVVGKRSSHRLTLRKELTCTSAGCSAIPMSSAMTMRTARTSTGPGGGVRGDGCVSQDWRGVSEPPSTRGFRGTR
jgi:hypothetical protein